MSARRSAASSRTFRGRLIAAAVAANGLVLLLVANDMAEMHPGAALALVFAVGLIVVPSTIVLWTAS